MVLRSAVTLFWCLRTACLVNCEMVTHRGLPEDWAEHIVPRSAPHDKIIFTVPRASMIYVMNLDGSQVMRYITPWTLYKGEGNNGRSRTSPIFGGWPEAVAVDKDKGRMFWADRLGGSGHADFTFASSIFSAPITPGSRAEVIPIVTKAFDWPRQHGESDDKCDETSTTGCPPASIHTRALQPLPQTSMDSPHGVALDPTAGVVYWSERGTRKGIYRSSYDGILHPPEAFQINGLVGQPELLAIDHRAGKQKLYWIEDVSGAKDDLGEEMYGHQIRSCDLDGANLKILATWLMHIPAGIALDTSHDKFYWTERVEGRIHRCPMTGCKACNADSGSRPEIVHKLFPSEDYSEDPSLAPKLGGIAVDSPSQTIFWTEEHIHLPEPSSGEMLWGGVVRMSKTVPGSKIFTLFKCRGHLWSWTQPANIALYVTSNQVQLPSEDKVSQNKNHASDGSPIADVLQKAYTQEAEGACAGEDVATS